MAASGPVTLTPTTTFEAEVAGDSNADLLDSTSTFAADGTLVVTLVDGYDPESYWTATIVTADQGVSGRFDELVAPTPDNPRLVVRVRYLAEEIRVGAVCKGDFNFDGLVNFFDVSAFLALYNAQDPDADLNNDDLWNFFDVSAYLSHYNAGCP